MNDRSRRIAAAIVMGLAVSTSVSACASGGGARSDQESASEIESAVLAAVPLAHDAYVGFASGGLPTSHSALVRIYVGQVETAQLAEAADATMKVVWRTIPAEPTSIGFQADEGQKPKKPTNGDASSVKLDGVADLLDTGYVSALGDVLDLSAEELASRYGAWTQPANE